MRRLVSAPVVSSVGMASVALLFVIHVTGAPWVLHDWTAGGVSPVSDHGWYGWPSWLSALLMAVTAGLIFTASVRLGAAAWCAASASLAWGLGWTIWQVAAIPSAKSVALLLVGTGVAILSTWRSAGGLVAATICFVASGWMQPLLLAGGGMSVRASPVEIARIILADIRPLPLVLAAAGAIHLWSQAPRMAWHLGVPMAVYLAMPLTGVVMPEAAMLPTAVLIWPAVAVGLHWLARARPQRSMVVLAGVFAILLPGERWLLGQALASRTITPLLPGSLAISLAAVGPKATLLSEDPSTDRQIGRAAAALPVATFRIERTGMWTPGAAAAGDVFAFGATRQTLESGGLVLQTVSRRVPLSAFLRLLPADSIVAIALTPLVAATIAREPGGYFAGIGSDVDATPDVARVYALIGRARAATGALSQHDLAGARVAVTAGEPWGEPRQPGPVHIDAAADRFGAAIAVEGREIARVAHGGVVVVMSREGLLRMVHVLTPEQRLSMPVPPDAWSLSRLLRVAPDAGRPLPDALFADPLDASALVRVDGHDAPCFASGWHLPERDGAVDFTWTAAARAMLRIPLHRPLELRVIVELRPAVADEGSPPLVALHVNGVAFDQHRGLPGRRMYEWQVPESAWRAGANDVAIELTKVARPEGTHDQRLLGAAVSLIRLERVRR